MSYFAHVLSLLVGDVLELFFVDSVVHCPDAASDEDKGDAADDDGEDVQGEAVGSVVALGEGICGVHFDRRVAWVSSIMISRRGSRGSLSG